MMVCLGWVKRVRCLVFICNRLLGYGYSKRLIGSCGVFGICDRFCCIR